VKVAITAIQILPEEVVTWDRSEAMQAGVAGGRQRDLLLRASLGRHIGSFGPRDIIKPEYM